MYSWHPIFNYLLYFNLSVTPSFCYEPMNQTSFCSWFIVSMYNGYLPFLLDAITPRAKPQECGWQGMIKKFRKWFSRFRMEGNHYHSHRLWHLT
jgi:hypothetical protein